MSTFCINGFTKKIYGLFVTLFALFIAGIFLVKTECSNDFVSVLKEKDFIKYELNSTYQWEFLKEFLK